MILWTRRFIIDKAKIIKGGRVSRPSRRQTMRKKVEKTAAVDIEEIIANDPATRNTNLTSCTSPMLEKPIETVETPTSGYMSVQS